jgi:hypothetical protein
LRITHQTPAIKRWLLRHPRFHLHFTRIRASWLNLVERWFEGLTEKQLRRGADSQPANCRRDLPLPRTQPPSYKTLHPDQDY